MKDLWLCDFFEELLLLINENLIVIIIYVFVRLFNIFYELILEFEYDLWNILIVIVVFILDIDNKDWKEGNFILNMEIVEVFVDVKVNFVDKLK